MTISTEQFVTIAVGTTANDGTGDLLRDAFIKVNNNFANITDIGIDIGNINCQGAFESDSNVSTTAYFVGNVAGNLYGNIARAFTTFGNVTLHGANLRIIGDFSSSTPNERLMFKTNAVNGTTTIGVIPSGSGTISKIALYNAEDATDAGQLELISTSTETSIKSSFEGVGTYLPFTVHTGGSEQIRVGINGNVTLSGNTAINQRLAVLGNVTVGNLYVPASAGAGGSPGQIVWDQNYIYICVDTNTWKRANLAAW